MSKMSKSKFVFRFLNAIKFQRCYVQCVRNYRKVRLEKIGKVEEPKKLTEHYASGQSFIHKAFPYRGIVIYKWPVKVHDYALENEKKIIQRGNIEDQNKNIQTYYQVLVDSRDSHGKFFNNKNLSVKYFPDHTQKVIEIPDMDYVAHNDIIPYQSTEQMEPILHPAFYTFFDHHSDPENGNQFTMRDEVKKAQQAENSWMCMSDVYKDTTDDFQVTVIPFYMGSRFGSSYTWRYSIRIDYYGDEKVTILDKILHLTIDNNLVTNASIMMDCFLTKKMPSYQFYDNILLESASAQMWGEFSVERADQTRTRCTIPVIKLNVLDNQNLRLSITDLKNLGS